MSIENSTHLNGKEFIRQIMMKFHELLQVKMDIL